MNWVAIGAVGEAIGGVAVLVTVIYLSLQIRQNTEALRSNATNSASEGAAELYRTLCTDPDLAMIFVRGNAAPNQLSDSELARYFAFWLMTMFKLQNWYFQTRDSFMDDTLLASWIQVIRPLSLTPGFQMFWDQRKFMVSRQFQHYLESHVFATEPDLGFKSLGVSVENLAKTSE